MTQKVIKLIKHRQKSRNVLVATRSVLGRSNFGCNYSFWGMQGIYQLCTSGTFLRGWVNTYCMQVSVGVTFSIANSSPYFACYMSASIYSIHQCEEITTKIFLWSLCPPLSSCGMAIIYQRSNTFLSSEALASFRGQKTPIAWPGPAHERSAAGRIMYSRPMDSHMGSVQFVQLELDQSHPKDLLPPQGVTA